MVHISLSRLASMAEAVADAAEAAGHQVAICVVDAGGHDLFSYRMPGCAAFSAGIARKKARTAALTGFPTSFWETRFTDDPALRSLPGIVAVKGGLTIKKEGALGVSGAPAQIDQILAETALAALTPEHGQKGTL